MRTCKVCGVSMEGKIARAVCCSKRCYRQTPESKAYNRAYQKTPERKAYNRARQNMPEYRASERAHRRQQALSRFLGWMYAAGLPEAKRQAKGVTA